MTNTDDISGLSVAEVQFTAGGYSISGDALTITGSSGVGFDNQTGANGFSDNITLGASLTFTEEAGTLSLGGVISGSDNLIQGASGTTGTLVLGGVNTYTGTTTVSAGTLSIAADDNLGHAPTSATPGSLTLSGGTLATTASFTLTTDRGISLGASGGTIDAAGGTTLTYGGIAAGSGSLIETDTGTLVLSGANTYSGTTTLNGGTLKIAADNNLGHAPTSATPGSLTLSGGTLATTASFTLTTDRGISLGTSGGTIDVASGTTLTYGGIAAGSSDLTKTDAGTLVLSGANTYSGTTTLSAGTLQVGVANALPSTSDVTDNATLDLFGHSDTIGALSGSGTVTSSVAGAVTLTVGATDDSGSFSGVIQNGSGAVALAITNSETLSGTNTYTGTTTINGGTLTISADDNLGAAPGSPTTGSLNLDGGTLETTASFTLNTNRGISLGTSDTIDVASGTTLTYGGIIAGSGLLLTLGSGTLVLGGPNSFSGGLGIEVGTVQLGIANAIPSTVVVSDYAILDLDGHSDTIQGLDGSGSVTSSVAGAVTLTVGANNEGDAFSGVIQNGSGTVALTKVGTGTETLSGTNTYTGTTTINSGALSVSADDNLGAIPTSPSPGSLTLNGGTLATTANFTLNANRGISLVGAFSVIDVASGTTLTYNGIIAGSGELNFFDSGTLVLGGANTYSGATVITAGTLRVGAANALPSTSDMTDNGTLDLDGRNDTIGALFGSGTVTSSVTGAVTLTIGATNDSNDFFGVIQNGSGTVALTKIGTGYEALSNTNTYSGPTTLSAGTLDVEISNAIPITSDVTDNATLDLQGNSDTIGSLSGSGTVTSGVAGAVTLTVGATNHSGIFSGVIQNGGGTVALTKVGTGTETLSGANTYSGPTTISAGTLQVGAANALSSNSDVTDTTTLDLDGQSATIGALSGSGTVTSSVAGAVTLTVGASNDSGTFSGVIQNGTGTIALTMNGTGTETLSGAETYTGATTVSAGTLLVNGSLASASAVSVSSGAILGGGTTTTPGTIGGTVSDSGILSPGQSYGSTGTGILDTATTTFNSGSALDVDLNGTTAGSGFDQLNVTGTTALGSGTSTLNLSVGPNFSASIGATFVIVNTTAGVSGTFAGLSQGSSILASGQTFTISYLGNSGKEVVLTYQSSADTWKGSGSNSNWSTAANWSEGVPTAGEILLFPSGASQLTNVDNISGLSVAEMQFTGGGYSISGTLPITLTGLAGVGIDNATGSNTFSAPITLGANLTFTEEAGTLALDGAIGGSNNLTQGASGTTGTLNLSATNTYSGTTTINAGTLSISEDANLGADPGVPTPGSLTVNGGTLEATNSFTLNNNRGMSLGPSGGSFGGGLTYNGIIAGSGTLAITLGTLILGGANTYTGTITVSASGVLEISADDNLGAVPSSPTPGLLTLNGGKLETTATFTLNANRGISLGTSGGTISFPNPTTLTYNGVIAGPGDLTLSGRNGLGDTLILGGANTYSGTTTIISGAISISADDNLGPAPASATPGSLTLSEGFLETTATFTLNANRGISVQGLGGGFEAASGTTLTYNGIVAGSGILESAGAGMLVFGGANTYTGETVIGAGTLQLGNVNAIPSTSDVVDVATLDLDGFSDTIGALSNSGTVTSSVVGAVTLTVGATNDSGTFTGVIQNGDGTVALTKIGTGKETLSGANTYSGPTTISAGTLQVGAANALSSDSDVTDNANLDLDGHSDIIGALSGSGPITSSQSGAVTLTVGATNDSGTFSGLIQNGSGTVALTMNGTGTETLSGADTYTGATTVSAGTLLVNGSLAAGSAVSVSNGGTLGGGTTTTSGTVGGTVSDSGILSPGQSFGSTGTGILDTGSVTVHYGSGFDVDLNGTTAGSGYDQLNVTGAAALGTNANTLNLSIGPDFSASVGATFVIINTTAGVSGTFSGLPEGSPIVVSGLTFTISYAGNSNHGVVLTYQHAASIDTWTGSGSHNNWSTAGNWSGGAPTNGEALVFPAGVSNLSSVDDIAGLSLSEIRFTGGGYSITGTQALTLTGSSGVGIDNTTGTNTFAAPITLGANLTFTEEAGTLTLGGVIGGSFNLTQGDGGTTGTLVLEDANSYTGTTTISAGTLQLGIANAIPSTSDVTDNATFDLNGYSDTIGALSGTGAIINSGASSATLTLGATNDSGTFSGVVQDGDGTVALAKTGTGLEALSAANTYSGGTTISAGTLSISADDNLGAAPSSPTAGSLTLSGGTLYATATFTLSANRGISLGTSGGTIDVAGGTSLTYNGIAAGTGSLTTTDTGTLVLSGANTYTGTTTISAGTLQVGASNAIPGSSDLTDNATLDLDGYSDTIGALSGTGTVTSSVAGPVTLTVGATNDSGTFTGVIQNGGGTVALTKTGTGTETLSGANSYSSATTISGGILQVGAANAIPSTSDLTDNATLDLDGHSDAIGALSGSGTVTSSVAGPVTLTVGATNDSGTFT
ncbi:MAG: autotransporter-associated beta strand repeat-containing protein, partial [Isosphaeraceae bacterium]